MKRNGSITIFIMITFSICLIISYFSIEVFYTQSLIQLASQDKIQSDLLSESKIMILLEDKNIFDSMIVPKIHDYFRDQIRNKGFDVKLEDNLVVDDTYKKAKGNFYKEEGKLFLELETSTRYRGIRTDITAKASVINDIFELDNSPVISYGFSDEIDQLLKEYLGFVDENISNNNLSNVLKKIYTFDHEVVKIEKGSNDLKNIIKIRNGTETVETFEEELFLVMKNELNIPTKLIIADDIVFSGVLYIEGDIIIESDFDFSEIIIQKGVNNSIIVDNTIKVDENKRPKISGIVLTEGNTSFIEFIEIVYESSCIYKYGIYLPRFLQPKILLIKKY